MFRKIFVAAISFATLIAFSVYPIKAANFVNIYFFWGDGCPHCAAEKQFLAKIAGTYPQVKIQGYEIYNNSQNADLLLKVADALETRVQGVPFTVIADKVFVGYSPAITTAQIEDLVKLCSQNTCPDSVASIVNPLLESQNSPEPTPKNPFLTPTLIPTSSPQITDEIINLPLLGDTNVRTFSLPLITIVLGALDGFNPCAMWTLLFLISMLIGMHDKKRRWILGTAFIVASASVYFFFMTAWLNLLLFIGFVAWVQKAVGSLAIVGGIYNLREYIINKDSGCKVTGDESRQAVFDKLKSITQRRNLFLALGGIILLAFAVNLVELVCSAGLPVVFTQILTLNNLSSWQYYAYMLLYIFFFMLDDLFIFVVSMLTLEMTGLSTKYARASHLVGGFLMLLIGLLLIFKPELLMFG